MIAQEVFFCPAGLIVSFGLVSAIPVLSAKSERDEKYL